MTEHLERYNAARDAARLRELYEEDPALYWRGLLLALVQLGLAMAASGQHADALAAVDESIAVGRDAASGEIGNRATALAEVAVALQVRFELTDVLDSLNEAVTVLRLALSETSSDAQRSVALSNLGNILRSRFERTGVTADLAEAVKLQRQALDAAPVDEQDRTALLSNLGSALRLWFEATGDVDSLDEAIALFRQAASATRPGGPSRTPRMSNLGAALRARFGRTGDSADLTEAETLLRQAIIEATPDVDQPVLRSNLGDVLRDLGDVLRNPAKLAEAQEEFERALAVRERVLGPEHPDVLATRNSLASVLAQRGMLAEAEGEFRGLVELQGRVLGPEHPDVLATRNNLASVLAQRGMLAEAEGEFRGLVELQGRVLGPEHPDVLATRNNLASVLAQQHNLVEAETEFRAVLRVRQLVLGSEHPDTLATRTLLTGASDAVAKARAVPERGWPAVHRGILAVDLAAFSSRETADQITIRQVLFTAMRESMDLASLPWHDCSVEDTGDGLFVLIPPELPKIQLVRVADELEQALTKHNAVTAPSQRMRLRMALHAGEVRVGPNGVLGTAVIHAARLLDAPPLKAALANSGRNLALIVSDWFYEEVVSHNSPANAAPYRRVEVRVKETSANAWIRDLSALSPTVVPERAVPASSDARMLVELTDALLAVPSLNEDSQRRLLIDLLPPEIGQIVPYHSRARLHFIAMVRTCLRYEGGLDALLRAVEMITPTSLPARNMREVVERIRSSPEAMER